MFRTVLLTLLIGCPKPVPVEAAVAPVPRDDVLAVTWVQTSAEADAVARTVFAAARLSLDDAIADPTWTAALEQTGALEGLTPAIVVDVDETVLDNSPYQARMVRDGTYFAKDTWGAWIDEAAAPAIPGAADFLNDAKSLGVDVFYVSNREVTQEEPTRKNLAAAGFPDTDDLTHFAFRPADGDRTKTTRRKAIGSTHRIVMLFGDNLFDFVEPDQKDAEARTSLVEAQEGFWGTRWFMLPNPMYGSWDEVLHGYEHPDAAVKHDQRLQALDPAR